MSELKTFRKANGLLQKDLADFLGVSREFVSMAESGKAPLPYNHLRKLLNNNKGWDVSALEAGGDITGGNHIEQNGGKGNIGMISGDSSELLALRKENEMLRAQIEELKAQNEKYWEAIKDFMKK